MLISYCVKTLYARQEALKRVVRGMEHVILWTAERNMSTSPKQILLAAKKTRVPEKLTMANAAGSWPDASRMSAPATFRTEAVPSFGCAHITTAAMIVSMMMVNAAFPTVGALSIFVRTTTC
mmetsp:Transcript_49024/g.86328  ORF Transcript_49024/g.86328 Transcript_49024/m.86328 type:complete len:122 (+) Transcript_49024:671-1036(+)